MSDREPGFDKPFPEAPEPETPAASSFPAPPVAGDPAPPPPSVAAPPAPPPAQPAMPPPPAGFVPPVPLLPDPTPRVGYAGFWIRVLAWLIDFVVLFLVNAGAHTVIRLSAGVTVFPLWTSSSGGSLGLSCAEGFVELVVDWLYFALFESSAAEATLGKQALRLRVTDLQGRRISFARASGRYFAKLVSVVTLGIGFVMVAFTTRRQGLHDMMAETVVLRDYR